VGSNPTGVHGCLSVVNVVCCQVEVSPTSRSLVQRSPTDFCASFCGIQKPEDSDQRLGRRATGKKIMVVHPYLR